MKRRYELIEFESGDGFICNLHHFASDKPAGLDPVIVLHGAGVRANIFLAPTKTNFVDALLAEGYDVWLLNWRASIDLPPNQWDLDKAAVHDHPAAVKEVLRRTGSDTLKAVIHCQGSTSFMMSITAGLLPEVKTVVSNAVALHPIVPTLAYWKSMAATDTIGSFFTYLNPQWAISAPGFLPKLVNLWSQIMHRENDTNVGKMTSFTFGAGFPTLWQLENLNGEIKEWLKGEFANVPMTFFRQMKKCLREGVLYSTGAFDQLPKSFDAQPPRTDARFCFVGGELNSCFLPESQARTYDFFAKYSPGRHVFHQLAGYGHLDVFVGENASRDIFPLLLAELAKE